MPTRCSSSENDSGRQPVRVAQAHITALDNRAGIEELLTLLKRKEAGTTLSWQSLVWLRIGLHSPI